MRYDNWTGLCGTQYRLTLSQKSAQKYLKSERNSYLCFEKHVRQNQVIENKFIVDKGYAYFKSEIGHQINSKIPKLVLLSQFENFFENIISYAAVLDS